MTEQPQDEEDNARRQAEARDEADIARHYRTTFNGPSMGTEEEPSGAVIRMRTSASNLIGLVRHIASQEVLVLITRDIQVGADDTDKPYGMYAIELRTTPTEARTGQPPGQDGWDLRRRALQIAIWAIENYPGKPLASEDYAGYRTEIANPDHTIHAVPPGGITDAGRQLTVGIPADAIGTRVTQNKRAAGTIHPLLTLPWYQDRFTADPAAAALYDREKVGYALVMSEILNLAVIWTRYPGRLNQLEAKNAWVVRPRTPPIVVIESFTTTQAATDTAVTAIRDAGIPSWADEATRNLIGYTWGPARQHIITGKPMGGHPPPDSTINGSTVMLFEYRQGPVTDYPYAFWRNGEFKGTNI